MITMSLSELKATQRKKRRRGGKRDPYVEIMIAALEGRGVRLSAAEVVSMSVDHAIEEAAFTATEDE